MSFPLPLPPLDLHDSSLLVVEDDRTTSDLICLVLEQNGFTPVPAYTAAEAVHLLQCNPEICAAVIDLSLPDGDGIDVMRQARQFFPGLPCFVLTVRESVNTIVVAMKAGATDYMVKPFDPELIVTALRSSIEVYRGSRVHPPGNQKSPAVRKWRSPRMQAAIEIALKAAKTNSPVMITGCHNTGKKAIAELIHHADGNKAPLICIDAALIKPIRLAAELFGTKGVEDLLPEISSGKLEKCRGGSIYLENIEMLTPELQAELFQWITRPQSKIEGESPRCRLITSTTQESSAVLADGHLRQDLWYALRVYHLEIPKLAERPEDLPLLCEDTITSICIAKKLRRPTLTRKVAEIIQDHTWQGNLSELHSVLEHAITHTQDGLIGVGDLPSLKSNTQQNLSGDANEVFLGLASITDITKAHLIATLDACDGNRRRAAQRLNISLRTVYNMIQRYKITDTKRKKPRTTKRKPK